MSRRSAEDHTATVRGLVLAVIGGLLLGLVSIHGLSLDTPRADPVQMNHAASVVDTLPNTSTQLTAATVDQPAGQSEIVKHCGLLLLCLFALASAALLALVLYVKLRRKVMALSPRRLKSDIVLFLRLRPPGAPLATLSILRC